MVIDHDPVGQVVSERDQPWEEDGVLVMPVYEEQLVVTKRLVLKERLRVRRVATTDRQLFEETLRRERLVIEDPRTPASSASSTRVTTRAVRTRRRTAAP